MECFEDGPGAAIKSQSRTSASGQRPSFYLVSFAIMAIE